MPKSQLQERKVSAGTTEQDQKVTVSAFSFKHLQNHEKIISGSSCSSSHKQQIEMICGFQVFGHVNLPINIHVLYRIKGP